MLLLVKALATQVPATPDADEARQEAVRELSKPAYHPRPNLLEQLVQWLGDHLALSQMVPGAPGWLPVLIVGVALALLVGMIGLLLRRVTLASRSRIHSTSLFDDERSSAALSQAADLFDSVRYGKVVSTPAQDEWMRNLAVTIAQTRRPVSRAEVS